MDRLSRLIKKEQAAGGQHAVGEHVKTRQRIEISRQADERYRDGDEGNDEPKERGRRVFIHLSDDFKCRIKLRIDFLNSFVEYAEVTIKFREFCTEESGETPVNKLRLTFRA